MRIREVRLSDNTIVFEWMEDEEMRSRGVKVSDDELKTITLYDIKEAFKDVDMTKKDKSIVKIAERAVNEFRKAKEREERMVKGRISKEAE